MTANDPAALLALADEMMAFGVEVRPTQHDVERWASRLRALANHALVESELMRVHRKAGELIEQFHPPGEDAAQPEAQAVAWEYKDADWKEWASITREQYDSYAAGPPSESWSIRVLYTHPDHSPDAGKMVAALRLLREYRGAPKFSHDHDAIKRTVALEDEIDAFLAGQQESSHDE